MLWISAMALKIKYQVDFVVGDGYGVEEEEVDAFIRLDTVYQIFYFLGALEITVWAILGVVNRKQAGERKKVDFWCPIDWLHMNLQALEVCY